MTFRDKFYSKVVSLFVSFGENPVQREVMFQTEKSPRLLTFRGAFSPLINREPGVTLFLLTWSSHFVGRKLGLGVAFLI